MSSALYALGRACHRRYGLVIGAWVLILMLVGAGSTLLGQGTTEVYTVPGSESQQALDDLAGRFPEIAGSNAQIVVVGRGAAKAVDAEPRRQITQAVKRLEGIDGVVAVTDPFSKDVTGAVSDDGKAALITVQLKETTFDVPAATKDAVAAQTQALRDAGLTAENGGPLFGLSAPGLSWVEGMGLAVAAVVLLIFFRSVRAAATPLLTALAAAGTTGALIMLATVAVDVTGTSPLLALMLGIAVGIDYALFLLSRHRENLAAGLPGEEAAARATATAGSAVVFAGFTVITALLGLIIVGLPFLSAMGVSAAIGVAIAVASTLTLGPALTRVFGQSFLGRKGRREAAARARESASAPEQPDAADATDAADASDAADEAAPTGPHAASTEAHPATARAVEHAESERHDESTLPAHPMLRGWAFAWVRAVTRWPVVTVVLVTGLLVLAAIPATDLRLALPDNGTKPVTDSSRRAFDLVDQHFGPGENGPLLVVAKITANNDPLAYMDKLKKEFGSVAGVDRVTLSTPNRDASTGVVVLVPSTGPSDPATADLVDRLRDTARDLTARDGYPLAITGATAVQIDVSERLSAALLPFGVVVMGLSLVLLLVVFRSFVVPLTATLGFLLSTGAAFGVVAAVFEWGWAADLLHVTRTGPVISFMPIILMGVLFGLAMDYQMFIVSRMHEHYVHHGDPNEAIRVGFTSAAPVVAAAGAIMTAVFVAFVPEGDASLKPIALGLTVGVVVDAFLVRMILVPASLQLFGHAAWAMPAGLRRRLPHLDVEGQGVQHQIAVIDEIVAAPDRVVHARGLGVTGGRGTVYLDLDLDLARGQVCALSGQEGSGKTAVLLTLAGRMSFHHGELDVAGAVLPEQPDLVQRRVGLGEIPGVNDFDPDLSVRQHIAERLAMGTMMPWASRRQIGDVMAHLDEACDIAARAGSGARTEPTFIDPTTRVRDLPRLTRAVFGVVLAAVGGPALIVVDDVDALRTQAERVGLWAVLGWMARSSWSTPAIVATCQDPIDADELADLCSLPRTDVATVRLASDDQTKVSI